MSSIKVKNFFTFYDKLPNMLLSVFSCKYWCVGCNVTFYAKSKCHFEIGICEHLGISPEKKEKIDNNELTAIQEQLSCFT